MSSTTRNNNAFTNVIEENEDEDETFLNRMSFHRPSLVPRQISFSQRQATSGEIILVLLPYFILIMDIFLFFLLRAFKF
jgi:hypothetical protein